MAIADIYQKATLVQIPSGYKAADAKLYSVLPNTADGDFTVSADADATRVNKDGLIESTSANQARLNYNFIDGVVQPDPYLLLEPARANLIVRSETFNLWGDVGVTVTEDATIAPTGAQTADLLTSTANNWRRSISYTITNGGGYVFSCFVKKHTTTDNIRFELYKGSSASFLDFVFSTQALSASDTSLTDLKVENYPNDWYRVSCKFTANGTNFICYAYPSQGYGTSGSAYFWGAQLEQGSYPTSYIPTSGSAVTRTNDLISNSYTGLTSASGTIFIDLDTKGLDSSYSKIIALRDTVTGEALRLEPHLIGGVNSIAFFGINGVNPVPLPADTLPINNRKKIALTFSGSNFKYASDGVITTGTYTGTTRQYNQAGGANITGGAMHNGIIHQLMVFDEVLSDSELEEITSYKSFGQMAKALLYTIE